METLVKLLIQQSVIPIKDQTTLRVMSYNIRMAPCAQDDATENAWVHRLPKINMIFNHYIPDIIGIQEMSAFQMQTLKNSKYTVPYNVIGKPPTKSPTEYGLGIAYNTLHLQLVSELHTVWLNESQTHAHAPAWDSSDYERYALYAKFKHTKTGKLFWFITTHFDHQGVIARQESAKIIMDLADSLDAPVIITGDFNCFPQLGGPELYRLLCTHSKHIQDSGTIADTVFGVPGTWMGWDYDPYKQRGNITSKYDFVFVSNTIQVLQQGIIDDQVWDANFNKALYPSDHRPIVSDVCL